MQPTGGVRTLIERMGIDPNVVDLVKRMERQSDYKRLIDNPPPDGERIVTELLSYMDGQVLINCVFAFIIDEHRKAANGAAVAAQLDEPLYHPIPPAEDEDTLSVDEAEA